MTRPLGDEFNLGRSEVGISVDRHAPEGNNSGDHHCEGQYHHQKALTKRRLYDSMDHSGAGALIFIAISIN
jgi:hypothetical protein